MTVTPSRTARLMSTADLAELVGVEQRTIERWRKSGDGPPYLAFGRTIRYHPARVQQWLMTREQGTPSSRQGAPARTRAPRGR